MQFAHRSIEKKTQVDCNFINEILALLKLLDNIQHMPPEYSKEKAGKKMK